MAGELSDDESGLTPLHAVHEVDVVDPGYRAHKLRLAGTAWDEIATQVGFPSPNAARMSVRGYLTRAAADMDKAQRAEALQLELDRLDALQQAFWTLALAGDDKAASTVLNLMKHRSKLLGLEEPQLEQQGARTVVIAGSHEEYVAGLRAVVEAQASPPESAA